MQIKKQTKQILDSSIAKDIIAGGLSTELSFINPLFAPIPGIAWEGAKLLLDKIDSKNILQKRLIEFLIFIGDNKEIIEDNLTDPNLISGLITLYEFTMKQRFERKRLRAFGIFLGFVNTDDKENFELERMYNTLNLMSLNDLEFLSKNVEFITNDAFEYFIDTSSFEVKENGEILPLFDTNDLQVAGFKDQISYNNLLHSYKERRKIIVKLEEVSNLCNLGILTQHGVWGGEIFKFTNFGNELIKKLN